MTAANDIDASVRRAPANNETRTLTWSVIAAPPALNKVIVISFGANCLPLGNPSVVNRSGEGAYLYPGTVYVAIVPVDRFAQLSWTLH